MPAHVSVTGSKTHVVVVVISCGCDKRWAPERRRLVGTELPESCGFAAPRLHLCSFIREPSSYATQQDTHLELAGQVIRVRALRDFVCP